MNKFFIFDHSICRGENMKKRKLKQPVVYALYSLAFVTVLGTIYVLEMVSSPSRFIDDSTYVNKVILDNEKPVVSTNDTISRPYVASNISIARTFYSRLDDEENQKNSLIYYQGTYLQNSGVDYKSDEIFDVVAIYDGKVTRVSENTLLGKMIEITHDNNMVSVYQSLGETSVTEGEQVMRGQVIGKSGVANISTDLGNHLHFEIIHNGKNVNPENYYDKQLKDL